MSGDRSYPPLPAGEYVVAIDKTQIRLTHDRKGRYLEVTLRVLFGPYRGRLLWARLSLWHKRPGVAAFAAAQLGALRQAVGLAASDGLQDVRHIPLVVEVSRRGWNGEIVNDVSGFRGAPPAFSYCMTHVSPESPPLATSTLEPAGASRQGDLGPAEPGRGIGGNPLGRDT